MENAAGKEAAGSAISELEQRVESQKRELIETKQLLAAERLRHNQTRIRSNVFIALGHKLSAVHTPEEAARIIVNAAEEIFGWDACSLDLISVSQGDNVPILTIDTIAGQRSDVPPAYEQIPTNSLGKKVFKEGAQLILRDPSTTLQKAPVNAEQSVGPVLIPFGDCTRRSESLMFVPIRHNEENIGVLSIQSYAPYAYSQEDLVTFQALADYCGAALQRLRIEASLRESEIRFRAIFENSREAMGVTANSRHVYVNQAFATLFGYDSPQELIDVPILDLIAPEAREVMQQRIERRRQGFPEPILYETRGLRRDGSEVDIENYISTYQIEGAVYTLVSIRDVTERNQQQQTLYHQAYHDTLTGLPNRNLFFDRLDQAIASAHRRCTGLAVLFIDLDHFKEVNDTLGHDMGDRLLREVALRFTRCLRIEDTIARMGGDEFTVLLPEVNTPKDAVQVARKLEDALKPSFLLAGKKVFLTLSIGISLYPADGQDAQTLLKHADVALYGAKEQGRGSYTLFTSQMNVPAYERLVVESELRLVHSAVLRVENSLRSETRPGSEENERRGNMLKSQLLHPDILRALAGAGHGAQVLIADGNYPSSTGSAPEAVRVYLNLAPGLITATDALRVLATAIPIEAAHVMQTADGSEPPIFEEFRTLLPGLTLLPVERFAFYAQASQPQTCLVIATGEQRIYANVLLTIGVVPPE